MAHTRRSTIYKFNGHTSDRCPRLTFSLQTANAEVELVTAVPHIVTVGPVQSEASRRRRYRPGNLTEAERASPGRWRQVGPSRQTLLLRPTMARSEPKARGREGQRRHSATSGWRCQTAERQTTHWSSSAENEVHEALQYSVRLLRFQHFELGRSRHSCQEALCFQLALGSP